MEKKKIAVVGSLNMDMVTKVDHVPAAGETILGEGLSMVPGGKGANQAYAAGKLGGCVVMLGAVGDDGPGQAMGENLSRVGVDTQYMKAEAGVPSGTAWICVNRQGNNAIVVLAGANNCCDAAYIEAHRKQIEDCDYLLVQLEIPLEAAALAVRIAHEAGKTVILNPAPARSDIPAQVFSMVDLITPNETELFLLTGKQAKNPTLEEIKAQAGEILRLGAKQVLVTLGDKGSMLAKGEERIIFPAKKVKAVDTTAAGDCFNGALAVALAEGKSLEDAVGFASAASAIAVQRPGAQTSIPEREEVEG